MQYVISPGNVGCKEVSPMHHQLTKYIFISIDPRMAWVPSFCKISNARSQRWIWWFLELPRNQGDHYWQRQDRNDSRSSGYSMGRPRSIGLRLEKTWLRCTYSWAHPRVRRTAVWRKILYQSRQCHRLLLSIEQRRGTKLYIDGYPGWRYRHLQLHDSQWRAQNRQNRSLKQEMIIFIVW